MIIKFMDPEIIQFANDCFKEEFTGISNTPNQNDYVIKHYDDYAKLYHQMYDNYFQDLQTHSNQIERRPQ